MVNHLNYQKDWKGSYKKDCLVIITKNEIFSMSQKMSQNITQIFSQTLDTLNSILQWGVFRHGFSEQHFFRNGLKSFLHPRSLWPPRIWSPHIVHSLPPFCHLLKKSESEHFSPQNRIRPSINRQKRMTLAKVTDSVHLFIGCEFQCQKWSGSHFRAESWKIVECPCIPVSYTHLTLPTILLV